MKYQTPNTGKNKMSTGASHVPQPPHSQTTHPQGKKFPINKPLLVIAGCLPGGLLRRIGAWQWTGPLARKMVAAGSKWIRNQDVVISHGVGAGLKFNASGANPGYAFGTTEPLEQETLQRLVKPGDVVYDIGANVGFFTVILGRLVGSTGAVAAFEPLPSTAESLRRNVALNNFAHVAVFATAVGRCAGNVKMALRGEITWTALADAKTTGPTVDVPMIAIDDLVEAGTIRPPSLVKIDVEGAELEVIEGMRRMLLKHRPVVLCEMHGKNAAYAALMQELNYNVSVVESPLPLAEARWDVHALATPR